MKSFKKGIALIAVLAFLITAILPVSGLAAEELVPVDESSSEALTVEQIGTYDVAEDGDLTPVEVPAVETRAVGDWSINNTGASNWNTLNTAALDAAEGTKAGDPPYSYAADEATGFQDVTKQPLPPTILHNEINASASSVTLGISEWKWSDDTGDHGPTTGTNAIEGAAAETWWAKSTTKSLPGGTSDSYPKITTGADGQPSPALTAQWSSWANDKTLGGNPDGALAWAWSSSTDWANLNLAAAIADQNWAANTSYWVAQRWTYTSNAGGTETTKYRITFWKVTTPAATANWPSSAEWTAIKGAAQFGTIVPWIKDADLTISAPLIRVPYGVWFSSQADANAAAKAYPLASGGPTIQSAWSSEKGNFTDTNWNDVTTPLRPLNGWSDAGVAKWNNYEMWATDNLQLNLTSELAKTATSSWNAGNTYYAAVGADFGVLSTFKNTPNLALYEVYVNSLKTDESSYGVNTDATISVDTTGANSGYTPAITITNIAGTSVSANANQTVNLPGGGTAKITGNGSATPKVQFSRQSDAAGYEVTADVVFTGSTPVDTADGHKASVVTNKNGKVNVVVDQGGLTVAVPAGQTLGKPVGTTWTVNPQIVKSEGQYPITVTGPAISGTVQSVDNDPVVTWSIDGTEVTDKDASGGTLGIDIVAPTLAPTTAAPTLEIGSSYTLAPGPHTVQMKVSPNAASKTGNAWVSLPGITSITTDQSTGDLVFNWNIQINASGELDLSNPQAGTFVQTTAGSNEWQADQQVPVPTAAPTASNGLSTTTPLVITGPVIKGTYDGNNSPIVTWRVASNVEGGEVAATGGTGTGTSASPFTAAQIEAGISPTFTIANPSTYFANLGGKDNANGTATVTLTITPGPSGSSNSWGQLMGTAATTAQKTAAQVFTWTISNAAAGTISVDQPSGSPASGTFNGTAPNWASTATDLAITAGDQTDSLTLQGPAMSGIPNSQGDPTYTWSIGDTVITGGTGVAISEPAQVGAAPNQALSGSPTLVLSGNAAALQNAGGTTVPVKLTIDPDPSTWATVMGKPAANRDKTPQVYTWNIKVAANQAGVLQLAGDSLDPNGDNAWDASAIVSVPLSAGNVTITAPTISGTPAGSAAPVCTWQVNGQNAATGVAGVNLAGTYQYQPSATPGAAGSWTTSGPILSLNPNTFTGLKTDGSKNTVTLTVTPGTGNRIEKVGDAVPTNPAAPQKFTWTVTVTENGQLTLLQDKDTTGTIEGTTPEFTITPPLSESPTSALELTGPAIAGRTVAGSDPQFAWTVNGKPLPTEAELNSPSLVALKTYLTITTPKLTGDSWSLPTLKIGGATGTITDYNKAVSTTGGGVGLPDLALKIDGSVNEIALVVAPGTGNTWNTVMGEAAEGAQRFTWDVVVTGSGVLTLTQVSKTTGTLAGGETSGEWMSTPVLDAPEGTSMTIYGPSISGQSGMADSFVWSVNGETIATSDTSYQITTPAYGVQTGAAAPSWSNDGIPSLVIVDPSALPKGDNTVSLTVTPSTVDSWNTVLDSKPAASQQPQTFTWTIKNGEAEETQVKFTASEGAQVAPPSGEETAWGVSVPTSGETTITPSPAGGTWSPGPLPEGITADQNGVLTIDPAKTPADIPALTYTKDGASATLKIVVKPEAAPIEVTVTPAAALSGDVITPEQTGVTGVTAAPAGGEWTVEPMPDQGISASSGGVTINGDLLAPGTYTLTYKAPDGTTKTLTVNQPAPATYDITISDVQNGTVRTNPAGSAAAGATVTVTAAPASGYAAGAVTVTAADGTNVPVAANNTFTMPAQSVTVTATFTANTHVLTFQAGVTAEDEQGNVVRSGDRVAYGAVITFTAGENDVLSTDAGTISAASGTTWTFTMPDSAAAISVDTIPEGSCAVIPPAQPVLTGGSSSQGNEEGVRVLLSRNPNNGEYSALLYLPNVRGSESDGAPKATLSATDYPGQTARLLSTPEYTWNASLKMWTPTQEYVIAVGFRPDQPVDLLITCGATVITSSSPAVSDEDVSSEEETKVLYMPRMATLAFEQID